MPTNDFLEIATAGGANVETQAAYAADPDRPAFFADGIAPDANQHGKMFRQTSVIAAMVAQAICDITGDDMLDDGNSATQLANFKQMLRLSGNLYAGLAGGSANAIVLTLAPAVTSRLTGVPILFVPTVANTGNVTIDYGAGAIAVTMPFTPSALNYSVLSPGRMYTAVDNGTVIKILEFSAMQQAQIFTPATVVVPNTGVSTEICPNLTSNGGAMALVAFDDGASDTASDFVTWYQFSNATLNGIQNSQGSPGTRSYISPSGTGGLNLIRSGGPANVNVNVRVVGR